MPERAPAASVDARGLECPLPVFHARDAILGLKEGDVLEVLADDPAAPSDIDAWARKEGHTVISIVTAGHGFRIHVSRGKTGG